MIKKFLLILILLTASQAEAREWKLLEIKDFEIDYLNYFPKGRDPLITNSLPNRQLGQRVALDFNIDILRYFYFNNVVHGTSDEGKDTGRGQFRAVGWNFMLGTRPFKYLSVEYFHHSQHLLDAQPNGGFPVEDGIQLRIHIYHDKDPSDTAF